MMYDERVQRFGEMIMDVMALIEDRPGFVDRWLAGELHVCVAWSPEVPLVWRAVEGSEAPISAAKPELINGVVDYAAMVAQIMDLAQADPGLVDRWQSGETCIVLSFDGAREIPLADIQAS